MKTFEEFIDCRGSTVTDLFFVYHCALEMNSKVHARKYASLIGEKQDELGDKVLELYNEYNERFLSLFGEPVYGKCANGHNDLARICGELKEQ